MKKLLFNVLLITVVLCHVTSLGKAQGSIFPAVSDKVQGSILPDVSEVYLTKLIETAKSHYPRVKSNQNRVTIAQNNIGLAKVSFYDEFSFSYVYQPRSAVVTNTTTTANGTTAGTSLGNQSYSSFNGVQVGIFFNIGNFLQKPYNLKNAKESYYIAQNDQAEYMLTLSSEVKKRYYIYLQRVAELKIQVQGTQDLEQALNLVKHRFDRGEDTYESYNKASTAYTDRTALRIVAEVNLFAARTDLEELLGVKLESIK